MIESKPAVPSTNEESGGAAAAARDAEGSRGQRDQLITEMKLLVRQGSWKSFTRLHALRAMPAYAMHGGTTDQAHGARAVEGMLRKALNEWKGEAARDAEAMAALLDLGRRGRRVLNGPDGARTAAGQHFNYIGHDQFARHYEAALLERFVEFLLRRQPSFPPPRTASDLADSRPLLPWAYADGAATALHRKLELDFRPDLLLAMSCPAATAAAMISRYNVRDLPILNAVTFPRREEPLPAERSFAKMAVQSHLPVLHTQHWSVYLPSTLHRVPEGTRIALLDDQLTDEDHHERVRAMLEDWQCAVAHAALFAPSACRLPDLFAGRTVEKPAQMPWGPSPGLD